MEGPGRHWGPGEPRKTGRWDWLTDPLGSAVGEGVTALLACATLALVAAGLHWGWTRHPTATAALMGVLVLLLVYGGWTLWRGHTRRTPIGGRLAIALSILVLAVGYWLLSVLAYCPCVGE